MKNVSNYSHLMPEIAYAEFQEARRYLMESFAESDRQRKENERILNEKFAETDRQMKETDRRMKELQKELSGLGQSQGSFAEEYFYNAFEKGEKNFFGKKFDDIEKNLKGRLKDLKDEYDIVLYNSNSVAIIEVKFKVRKDDIENLIKKAATFKILYPYYKDFSIYLGLASMVFPLHLEQDCIEKGIALIKQMGDMIIINDAHLKVF